MANKQSGFTLIELIVVVIIIGILASIAAPIMIGIQKQAILTEAVTTLSALRTSLKQYYVQYNGYPQVIVVNNGYLATPGYPFTTNFPGLDLNSLTCAYFGKECYYMELYWNADPWVLCVINPQALVGGVQSSAPYWQKTAMIADPGYPNALIAMDVVTGQIVQNGVSASGYPPCPYPCN